MPVQSAFQGRGNRGETHRHQRPAAHRGVDRSGHQGGQALASGRSALLVSAAVMRVATRITRRYRVPLAVPWTALSVRSIACRAISRANRGVLLVDDAVRPDWPRP